MADVAAAEAVNALTGRWVRAVVSDTESTALTGAAAWPLLALLAGTADGPARAELESALGVGADGATALGREVVEAMGAMDGVAAATGLWTHRDLPVRPEWEAQLPQGVRSVLTGDSERDRQELDAWAARHTDGAIDKMPAPLTPDTQLVLAGALLLKTAWRLPFHPGMLTPTSGPWRGRSLAGLRRTTDDVDGVLRIIPDTPAGPLTLSGVAGDNGLDVHLVLGAEGVPGGQVLEAGIGAVAGRYPGWGGASLPYGEAGPGVTVEAAPSWDETPTVALTTPQFTVSAEHDLLRHAELFGLRSAQDDSRGHFPGISPNPLAISSGQQSITASFSAEGFWAAAVTALAMAPGGGPPQRTAKRITVTYDRPFGFLAVHRDSGLVLTAGWVTEPEAGVDTPWGPPGLG
ncbi:serpin family protein [Streptomyces sp. NPDC059850]|uniref:serpin family protein n=1 Tax=Streptomyces sp. NPDC059850 TaxID=3346970 RepID=UPI00364890E6